MFRRKGAIKGTLCVTIFGVFALITVASGDTEGRNDKDHHPVCRSEKCKQQAKLLEEFMDKSTEPCQDFFSHACGSWIKKHENHPPYDIFQYLRSEFIGAMAEILGQVGRSDVNKGVIEKATTLYAACLNDSKELNAEDFLQIMAAHGVSEWPKICTSETHDSDDYKNVVRTAGISPILSYYVARGSTEIQKHVVKIFVLGIGKSATKNIVNAAAKFIKPDLTDDEASTISAKVEEFETKLLQIRMAALRSGRPQMTAMTLADLTKNVSDFPLADVLKRDFEKADVTLTEDDNVEVLTLETYKSMVDFLKTADPTTLYNYLGFYVVLGLAEFAFKDFVNSGHGPKQPRTAKCVSLVYSAMKEVATHMYAKTFVPLRAKREVEQIFKSVKDAFLEALRSPAKWLTERTKSKAEEKIQKLTAKIGYPDWVLQLEEIEKIYKDMEEFEPQSTFLQMMEAAIQYKDKLMMRKLRALYEKDKDWMFSPSAVTAFYNPSENELVYPVGGLRSPFYAYGLPKSVNYGAVGSVMAHEITHSFTGKGGLYDSEGRQQKWWEADDHEAFKTTESCFIEQYRGIFDEKANMSLNGARTLDENIADSVGLQMAFRAYSKLLDQECRKPAATLESLNEVWGKRLFFASYGSVWCDVTSAQQLKMKILYMPHSPNQYRVNVPTRNLQEFTDVFSCSTSENSASKSTEQCTMF